MRDCICTPQAEADRRLADTAAVAMRVLPNPMFHARHAVAPAQLGGAAAEVHTPRCDEQRCCRVQAAARPRRLWGPRRVDGFGATGSFGSHRDASAASPIRTARPSATTGLSIHVSFMRQHAVRSGWLRQVRRCPEGRRSERLRRNGRVGLSATPPPALSRVIEEMFGGHDGTPLTRRRAPYMRCGCRCSAVPSWSRRIDARPSAPSMRRHDRSTSSPSPVYRTVVRPFAETSTSRTPNCSSAPSAAAMSARNAHVAGWLRSRPH